MIICLPLVGMHMSIVMIKDKLSPPRGPSPRRNTRPPETGQTFYQRYPGATCHHGVAATECHHCRIFAEE